MSIKYKQILKEGNFIVANKYNEKPNKIENLGIVILRNGREIKSGFKNSTQALDVARSLNLEFKKLRKKL